MIDTKLYASKTTTINKKSPPKYALPINFDKKNFRTHQNLTNLKSY